MSLPQAHDHPPSGDVAADAVRISIVVERLDADDISAALIGLFELTAGTQKLDIASVFADDHHGVVVLRETASRPNGATLDVDEVHMLAIDGEGRITDLWDLPSDPEPHDRFFDGL